VIRRPVCNVLSQLCDDISLRRFSEGSIVANSPEPLNLAGGNVATSREVVSTFRKYATAAAAFATLWRKFATPCEDYATNYREIATTEAR
jgi:hypothetical protein